MIKIFDKPEYMTVEEIQEKFYPVSVVIANSDVYYHAPMGGYVMAAETVSVDDFEELFDFQFELSQGDKHGKVYMITTKYPFDEEIEFDESDLTETGISPIDVLCYD